jgi:hypothetical protein
MTRPTYDELAKAAAALVLSAPAKPHKWTFESRVNRKLLDKLADMLRAAGYDLDGARKIMREIEQERRRERRGKG